MPRKARVDAPGALQHIIVRGIERAKIFKDDTDRNDFLDRIGKLVTETKIRCFAWALLSNHFHLLVKTGQVPVARSLFCYWAVRELGMSMSELSRRLELSLAGVSQSVKRGEKIADEGGFCLIDI